MSAVVNNFDWKMKLNVTYCSGNKASGVYPPDRLYKSSRISGFVDKCRRAGSEWAIFSAKYGFFFPDEKKPDYNVTFKTDGNCWLGVSLIVNDRKMPPLFSKDHLFKLSSELRRQAEMRQIDQIVFYGPSPKMMKCYLAVLHYAFDGCHVNHGWQELIDHVKAQSRSLKVIHRLDLISRS
jgi:hypothetical protein